MPIKYHPDVGDVLLCDFSQIKTKEPEMVKRRPVICLTPRRRPGRLLTIVPLSTTAPDPAQLWHCKVHMELPPPYDKPEMWVKGDMLYTLSMDRFSPFHMGKDKLGKRQYLYPQLEPDELKKVKDCVVKGLGFFEFTKKENSD